MYHRALSRKRLVTLAAAEEVPRYVGTYRMFGMDAIENVLYPLKYSQPKYQWIAMIKTIIIDA